ncbi:uncharacterized protein LOC131956795 [Physella acuta]|uniref:uncharacterized protein LOC131956795 n=1 Tax=Physella acuta TaxID=109671 RepID=UPI0027DB005F|nr:uncharacterized protein LOC131956795 [Physella acuta]
MAGALKSSGTRDDDKNEIEEMFDSNSFHQNDIGNVPKTEPDSDEQAEIGSEFQANITSDNMYRNGIPAYSIVLYKQDPTPGNLHDLDPMLSQPSSSPAPAATSVPKLQPFLLAQNQQEAHSFISANQFPTMVNNNPMLLNAQQMDPLWVQILSNILSRPTEKQTSESNGNAPVIPSGIYPNVACPTNKTNGTLNQFKVTVANNGHGSNDENSNVKLLLRGSQNKNLSSYGRNNSTTKPAKGQFILLSPTSYTSELQVRPMTPSGPGNPGAVGFIPIPNNKFNPTGSCFMNINRNKEECQQPSPLNLDVNMIRKVDGSLDSNKLSEYNLPVLPNSPVIEHDGVGPMRESHNMKERRRRARIKDACNLMRQLVPGMSKKTDKATVFEFSARYIHFLKSFVGATIDKEFLLKYNPY